MTPYYFDVDMKYYEEELKDFLPDEIIDVHSHVTSPAEVKPNVPPPDFWAEKVCPNGMIVPSLLESHILMFPEKSVKPVIFALPSKRLDFEKGNDYVVEQARRFGLAHLILTYPRWTADELERRVRDGGFIGLKPYPVMVAGKPADQVEIFDILPKSHLEVANEKRWLIILHIPRPGRLDDPLNVKQLLEIDERYPKARVVVAHVGRSYCPGQGDRSLKMLQHTQNLLFDISANTNQAVFEKLIETIEVDRIFFGSDMPISAMHARRICEGDNYINITLGADWEDSHTRIGRPEDRITFFLYEVIAAFKKAASNKGLTRKDIERVFFGNAKKMLY